MAKAEAEEATQEIAPSQAPGMKAKLTVELSRVQQENEKLQTSLKEYDTLINTAETTLKTMEEQKTVFLESIAQARQNLLVELLPPEDDMQAAGIPAAGGDEEEDQEQQAKQP